MLIRHVRGKIVLRHVESSPDEDIVLTAEEASQLNGHPMLVKALKEARLRLGQLRAEEIHRRAS